VNWIKALAVTVILAVMAGSLKLWITSVIYGNYLENAGTFMAVMACAVPVFVVVVAFYAIKFVAKVKMSDFNF
jgi:hypothetical protein